VERIANRNLTRFSNQPLDGRMNTISLKLFLAFFIGILFLVPLLSSCGFGKSSKSAWVTDSNNYFHTNDVKRAQREVPFTIILPTYLPDDMDPNYPDQIDGPVKALNYHEVEIKITYIKGDRSIYISEQNVKLVMAPTEELDPIYLDIAGTKVLRQKAQMAGSSGITEGLVFDWNQNGLTFAVQVFSVSEEEAVKIIESMIK
jgi:hypothetical protein